jgi:aminoglycoside phosphotransferase (APT) family kinase protein
MPVPQQRDLAIARWALTGWLAARLGADDVRLSDIESPAFTGFSNETLLFDAEWSAGGEVQRRGMVARVKPTGYTIFLESAFEEQYRVMEALRRHCDVLVPPVLGYEHDASVLGAPFFVMEKVAGRIPEDNPPYHTEGWVTEVTPDERASMWWTGIDQMAGVHRVDWRQLGLDFLDDSRRGRPGLDQQLDYYAEYLAWAAGDRPQPVAEAALEWLRANRPVPDDPIGLCWGDARIGNMIFDAGRCVAVLDWEMVTLGPWEQDLAWWLFLDRHHSDGVGVARLEGFPSHAETIARYAQLMGRPARNLDYYTVFAGFRFAVIMIRVIAMAVAFELLPPDTDMGTNNIVTKLLAQDLGLAPDPDLTPNLLQ